MDKIIEEILQYLRAGKTINADKLNAIIRAYNKGEKDQSKHYAKKYLLPFFLEEKAKASNVYKS